MATGSMTNRLMGDSKSLTPTVGMGVTELMWSDRVAYTVVALNGPRTITIQRDKATRTDDNGMSDCQTYTFEADTTAETFQISLRRDGKWRRVGSIAGDIFLVGQRSAYHDYSF